VKDVAGALTGDKKLQAEGKADKAEGAARQSAGALPGKPSTTSGGPGGASKP